MRGLAEGRSISAEELRLVRVAADGHAFTAGGNEVLRHDGTKWCEVVRLHPDAVVRAPLALSSAGELPIVVAFRFLDAFQGRYMVMDCSYRKLELYGAGGC